MEGLSMPGIVEFPQVVREALDELRRLVRQRTGAAALRRIPDRADDRRPNKTVNGINAEFAHTTDQSCLNRFLTEVKWDEQALNERRLEELQKNPDTRYSDRGVIAIDDVLIDHDGRMIDDVGYFWDHAEQRNKIAHDDMFANYVCTSGKHYPLEFRRFKKREQCEATGETFEDHTKLFCQLIDWVCEHNIPGDFTFDSYFTNAENLNSHPREEGPFRPSARLRGRLEAEPQDRVEGEEWKASEIAASIPAEDRKPLRRGRSSNGASLARPISRT